MKKAILTILPLLLLMSVSILQAQEKSPIKSSTVIEDDGLEEAPVGVIDDICTAPKSAKTDKDFDCLKGRVHFVKTERVFFAKKYGKYAVTNVMQETDETYDKQGNKATSLVYRFDDKGNKNLLSSVKYNPKLIRVNSEKMMLVARTYNFDDKRNRFIQTATYARPNQQSVVVNTYNPDGRIKEIRDYYAVLVAKGNKKEYLYSDKGLGTLRSYVYEGNKTIVTHYNKERIIIGKYIFTYNEKGNEKEIAYYSINSIYKSTPQTQTTFNYDDKGNRIEMVYSINARLHRAKYVVGYDEKGNQNSLRMYDSNGNINYNESTIYQFDFNGNWLSYSSDKPKLDEPYISQIRTITYY